MKSNQTSPPPADTARHKASFGEKPDTDWGHKRGHWSRRPRHRWHDGPSPWHTSSPSWTGQDWHRKRRFLFLRFIAFFAVTMLLVLGGMGIFAFLLTTYFGGNHHTAGLVWVGGCGLALLFPILAMTMMTRAFRSYALPLADIMTASDQIAEGDLSVRLEQRGSREFQRLANSFNHMTAELERTEQQRRNLTADIAHELRTPLHIIQGNLEGVLDGVYKPTASHIEATLEETRLLARLVEDLRILSLAEAGELPLAHTAVDVNDLLADVVTSFSTQAEATGIALTKQSDNLQNAMLPLVVQGDPGRLDQIFSNLVTNALHHTPAGGAVTLAAKRQGDHVEFTVNDTGCGITPDELPFVFDRFWKGDRARTHTAGTGSGLGLAIARQLVEAHGGEIRVESVVGKGTSFTVTLPFTAEVVPLSV